MRFYLKKINLVFVLLASLVFVVFLIKRTLIKTKKIHDNANTSNGVKNQFCHMPEIEFDNEESMRHFKENFNQIAHTFSCDNENDYEKYETISISYIENGKSLIELNLNSLNLKSRPKCSMQKFDKDINKAESEPVKMLGNLIEFDENLKVEIDNIGFFYIYCYNFEANNTKVYENVVTILDDKLTDLLDNRNTYKKYVNDFKSSLNISILNSTFNDDELLQCCKSFKLETNSLDKMNVLVLGIDSLSFNHFKRALPLTFKYLNDDLKDENIVYDNFNSVGQSTHPNIVAFLSGVVDNTFHEYNLTNEMEIYRKLDTTFHDHLPFIWNSYEDLGYTYKKKFNLGVL
jgi:hypothetical protein